MALLPLPPLPRLPHLTPRLPPSFQGLGYFEEAKGGADKDGKAPPPKHKVLKIFRDMPERNHASLMLVYRRAAELFSKVEALIAKYRPWVAIGLHEGSLDDLVDACATEAADFEANFKVLNAKRKEASRDHPTPHTPPLPPQVLKAKRKEAEKLPATEKVDCITVNLAPFKAAVDDQQQRLTDALLYGMRRLSDTKKAEVDEFIAASMETLSRRPQSVDEIGTAKKEWREIVQVTRRHGHHHHHHHHHRRHRRHRHHLTSCRTRRASRGRSRSSRSSAARCAACRSTGSSSARSCRSGRSSSSR